jgi:hypothetical protein
MSKAATIEERISVNPIVTDEARRGIGSWMRLMPNSQFLRHNTGEVLIGGTVVEKRAVSFRLMTPSGFHAVIARLVYPADRNRLDRCEVKVSIANGEGTDLYFTGTVYSANTHEAHRELLLTHSYKKLWDKIFRAAYRKKAAYTLDAMPGAAEITQTSLTYPGVELARFSSRAIAVRNGIDLFIDALKEHGSKGLTYFFDEEDVFHF